MKKHNSPNNQPQYPMPPAVPIASLGRDDMNAKAESSGQSQKPLPAGYPVDTKSPGNYDPSEGER